MALYDRIRQEHWLHDRQEQGKGLILEDESIWEVHPSDQVVAARWLRGSTIYVEEAQTNSYPYLLRNHTEEETARANFLGMFRAVGR